MTTEIENTRRQMYADLKRFEHMVGSTHLFKTLQDSLEAHLEELRKDSSANQARIGELYSAEQQWKDIAADRLANLSAMTEERDQIQQRLHAIDHAYCEQSLVMVGQSKEIDRLKVAAQVAGECIHDTQTVNRSYQIEIKSMRQQLEARDDTIAKLRAEGRQYLDDCRSAEKLSDSLDEKLRDARAVIGQQEQLIVGQRLAISDLYLAGRRVNSAVATLQRLGYTDCGGQLWKPPIGKKPEFSEDYCETCEGLGYVHCNGGRPTAPCPEGCQ